MLLFRLLAAMWAYCQRCMTRQDFERQGDEWVCGNCKTPLGRKID